MKGLPTEAAAASDIDTISQRYRGAGRFARHYVAGKLRHDPVWPALCQLGREIQFGDVVDIGCGRGQFAAGLLQLGLARSVLGLECHARHLEQARDAMRGLNFDARLQDFAADTNIPCADTVLLIDVLYQLPTAAQMDLLSHAAQSAHRLLVVRTADPARGLRSRMTGLLERAFRQVWPHAGARVNAIPITTLVEPIEASGMTCKVTPCWSGTPFSNVLIVAQRIRQVGHS